MSTRELIEICEQLPEDKRIEVADFAQFLLAKNADAAPRRRSGGWPTRVARPRRG